MQIITANTQPPPSRENLLIVSRSADFQASHIRAAIAQTLASHKKILFIAANGPVEASLQAYRTALPPNASRCLGDLDVEIAPVNKPFAAFDEWNVIFATPAYLHRQLVTPVEWVQKSPVSDIGLIVIDGLDGCDTSGLRALLELALVRFCLQPLDGVLRQAIATIQPVTDSNAMAQYAGWLRAATETDGSLVDESAWFDSVWTPEQLNEVLLTLLASQETWSAEALNAVAKSGRMGTNSAFDLTLTKLLREGAVRADWRANGTTVYRLTPLGETMAQHRLSLADATCLHDALQTDRLSWFDLLLVASSSPDFPPTGGIICDETRPLLTKRNRVGSTLLQLSLPDLLARLQTTPQRLQSSIRIALAGYYVTRGWGLADIATQVHLEPLPLQVAILALQRRVAAMRTVAAVFLIK